MSKTAEISLMKRAALRAVVNHAIKSGSVKLVKRGAAERRQRMATFLKQAGVTGKEVLALSRSVKIASNMPSEQAFERVAKAAGLGVKTVKLAYLTKRADMGALAGGGLGALGGFALGGPIGALGGGLLGAGVGSAAGRIPNALSHSMNPYQMSPGRQALYQRIQNEAVGNKRMSQDLQAITGAFQPAASPWGQGGQLH